MLKIFSRCKGHNGLKVLQWYVFPLPTPPPPAPSKLFPIKIGILLQSNLY